MEGLSCARVQMIHQRCKKRKTDCIRADSHFCGNTCIIRCRIGVPFIVTQCAAAYGTVIALRQKRVIFRHVKKKKNSTPGILYSHHYSPVLAPPCSNVQKTCRCAAVLCQVFGAGQRPAHEQLGSYLGLY